MSHPHRHQTAPMITVFGGARCSPETLEYNQALQLGRSLAEAGYTVCTGGYAGVMEAISRGAHEVDGHVVGVTLSQLKGKPNPFLKETWPTDDFYARLHKLIQSSVAYMALRGGMGTVTEISLVWNKLYTGVIPPRPLILIGDCWPPIVEAFKQNLVVSEADVNLVQCVATVEQAMDILDQWSFKEE